MNTVRLLPLFSVVLSSVAVLAAPTFLDSRFEIPDGFHIYRAATPELSGGSYDLCFDGQGRLLVGDGNAVRRLADKDDDGIFDSYEVIATGLGWRGPQGLLVYGSRLYAVGGDGIQLFEGYGGSAPLVHKGRVGASFSTGGDHDAHTLLRGHDGYIYFVTGDGGGAKDRRHITEKTSPLQLERSASVFRISPDGTKWECVSAGGRNPPNLGQNYLGELFSLDSDMEWHVGLPWYRPVRLNHWAIGGDQGWQEVGAYPPHFVDCLPGLLDVGRGSPDWGVFHEHTQLPAKYQDAYLVCDYRWKRESSDDYTTTGRLLAFFLKRDGARWEASMDVLARPKPGALDENGGPISFALVDIEVAPDGSLYVSDHNQGIWRITFGDKRLPGQAPQPATLGRLLDIPQPASEWARIEEDSIRSRLGHERVDEQLRQVVLADEQVRPRLRALRLLAPRFDTLPDAFLEALAKDPVAEIRAQAAWLLGIRDANANVRMLLSLLEDDDPFVRRRAAEALTRSDSTEATESLIDHLADPSRLIRYIAMAALARRPLSQWGGEAELRAHPQIRLRAVVAGLMRRETVPEEWARRMIVPLLTQKTLVTEDRLDLLRLVVLLKDVLDERTKTQVANYVDRNFPDADKTLRWEQTRVLGELGVTRAFEALLSDLESETNYVTQFHIAQALAKLPNGWVTEQEERLIRWLIAAQKGWFSEFSEKGVEFPYFWSTVLAEMGAHHRDALLRALPRIDLGGLLGGVAVSLIADAPNAAEWLLALYRKHDSLEPRLKIVRALKKVGTPAVAEFLRSEYKAKADPALRGAILQSLSALPQDRANQPLFEEGLRHKDREVVKASAAVLVKHRPELTTSLAQAAIGVLTQRREMFGDLEMLLVTLSGNTPPGFNAGGDRRHRLDEAERAKRIEFWKTWYAGHFGAPINVATPSEKTDDEVHRFLLTDSLGAGDPVRGARLYETLQCHTCHVGGTSPGREGRIFGPDLAGVTRRLSRPELADALVFPSKQVADRFKAYQIEQTDGTTILGFVTEQTGDSVTIADQQQVQKVPRSAIKSLQPQANSLMPDRLLNRLTAEELRDLFAFLDKGEAAVGNGK